MVGCLCFSHFSVSLSPADMLEKGFEWSLQRGEPLNMAPKRYRLQEPCCKLRVTDHVVSCGHEWNMTLGFPKGDPLHGVPWEKAYPDPGTYVGGEVF